MNNLTTTLKSVMKPTTIPSTNLIKPFREIYTFEERKNEAIKIREKYPDRIPVIVEQGKDSGLPELDKRKFLVPNDLTCGQMMYTIRKRLRLTQEQAIFLFIDNKIPPSGELMSQLYKAHADKDFYLYILIQGENVFGQL